MAANFALSDDDRAQLQARGISEEEFHRQLACFARGFRPLDVVGPATLEDGLETIDASSRARWLAAWEVAARDGRFCKFVPASGAASRMFQALEARRARPGAITPEEITRARTSANAHERDLAKFFDGFDRFAFAPRLRAALGAQGHDPDALLAHGDLRVILDVMLDELGFAALPKGLIPFHRDGDGARTAFEEHLDEARSLVADAHGSCRVHFTVPPEFRARIEQHCRAAAPTFALGFSEQSPSTDTVAVDLQGMPLRDDDGRFVFRPGGHGALIDNLDALDADLVFVKNIDNVVPVSRRAIVIAHQRLLAGILIERQREAHALWHALSDGETSAFGRAMDFVRARLHRNPPTRVAQGDPAAQRAWLLDVLARPLRVCGMVRNEGEPGGGPYWVRDGEGGVSLQIVEAAQIDRTDPAQDAHVRGATHFNPVDLVCAVRGPRGERLSLPRYVDPDTSFIARKSKDGVDLQALERPGLWNGAMAHWNTVFVEVPLATFAPVKTVLDLLRGEHQGE